MPHRTPDSTAYGKEGEVVQAVVVVHANLFEVARTMPEHTPTSLMRTFRIFCAPAHLWSGPLCGCQTQPGKADLFSGFIKQWPCWLSSATSSYPYSCCCLGFSGASPAGPFSDCGFDSPGGPSSPGLTDGFNGDGVEAGTGGAGVPFGTEKPGLWSPPVE